MASDTPSSEKSQLLPDKSAARYVAEYGKFMKWHQTQNTNSFSEEVMVAYFNEMAKTFAPSTLVSQFSVLKPLINSKHNVDIGQYSELLTSLKKMKKEFVGNTPLRHFSTDEVNRFLQEAPDSKYLVVKAVTVFAICVSPHIDTLTNITMDCITDYGTDIVVRVQNPTTKQINVCTISGEMVNFVQNYMRLRPDPISTDRFFIQYRNEKCTAQHIGKNTMTKMPQKIAQFVGWSESDVLSGLSFRRMSKSILANAKRKRGSLEEKDVMSNCSTIFQESILLCNVQLSHGASGKVNLSDETMFDICCRVPVTQQTIQTTRSTTKMMRGTQGNNNPKNANEETVNIDPGVRIKQEVEQDFDAGEYILSDPNFYSQQNIVVKTEDELVYDKSNSHCKDPRNVNQDDRNATKITGIISEQQQHQHDLRDSLASDTYPNKRLKCSGGGEVITNDGEATCQNNSPCQLMIQTQANEIARLKKLTERQNVKIESLETLLLDNLRKKFESS